MNDYAKTRDEKRVLDAADRFGNITEEDEDEYAEWEDDSDYEGYSLIMVPNELAPKVSALIAKYDEREAAKAAK